MCLHVFATCTVSLHFIPGVIVLLDVGILYAHYCISMFKPPVTVTFFLFLTCTIVYVDNFIIHLFQQL